MTTLDSNDGYMVLINTFTVEPDRADELLGLLSRATEEVLAGQPGFVSANLHMSYDRKHVTNYAQWRSKADYEAVFKVKKVADHMQQAADAATSFDPIEYELREVHDQPIGS